MISFFKILATMIAFAACIQQTANANPTHATNMNETTESIAPKVDVVNFTERDHLRFLSKVQKTDNCWLWLAHKNRQGYGMFWFNGTMARAHKISYLAFKGAVPFGLCVCHSCDNPSCVNPDHLWLGTIADNNADRDIKGRQVSSSGEKNGGRLHPEMVPRGKDHGKSKLTEEQVIEIRRLRLECGLTYGRLAAQFCVTAANICSITLRHTWAHI